jgi:hypothetical protein
VKIGLVGPSYQQRSLPFDAQRTINLFPVFDEQGKEVAALYGTPGLEAFATAGDGPVRGGFASTNGRVFFVSGDSLYEVLSAGGAATFRGTLNTSTGNVTIDENATQLFICDQEDGYILTYSSNIFAQVTSAFPLAGTVTFIDGYFVVNQNDTGKFYVSALNDGFTWDALDFATAESSPDRLVRVVRAIGQLWLLGNKTSEIWTNTGTASFPFQKISGAELTTGTMAAHTAVEMGSTLYWVGESDEGRGIVYRANGFTPQRISTEAIEIFISKATSPDNLSAFKYQQDGHEFYILTGGGLETTLVYDITTNLWHERSFLNELGVSETHLMTCVVFGFGYYLVGDRRNGNIYKMKLDVYNDNGSAIARERIYTHLSDEGRRVRYNKLRIGFETGVGLQTGQGSDPQVNLQLSRDGARTFSDSFTASLGAVGQYRSSVEFRRLGIAEQMTFKIRVTDPVKVAIIGSYLE